jgi:hypothetical protein
MASTADSLQSTKSSSFHKKIFIIVFSHKYCLVREHCKPFLDTILRFLKLLFYRFVAKKTVHIYEIQSGDSYNG